MVYGKDMSLSIKHLYNHEYGGRIDQWQIGKSDDEGNMPQYKYQVCQIDKTDIVKSILSLYSGLIKHHHTKWEINQMSLKASFIRENMTITILQPIVKTCLNEDYRR